MIIVESYQYRKLSAVLWTVFIILASDVLGFFEGREYSFVNGFYLNFFNIILEKKYLHFLYSLMISPFISVANRDCRFFKH